MKLNVKALAFAFALVWAGAIFVTGSGEPHLAWVWRSFLADGWIHLPGI